MQYQFLNIQKHLQSGFEIKYNDKIIYIDPFKLPANSPIANVIFISHEHFDHCHEESLELITDRNTFIVGNQKVFDAINGKVNFSHFVKVEPCAAGNVDGVEYTCVNAYNINKFRSPGVAFHPKENSGVGYILEFKDNNEIVKIYHAGDTDFIEEMKELPELDVAILPVSGTYVMTPEEAATAAKSIKAEIFIPMHYDSGVVGSPADAEKFKDLLQNNVEILEAA